MIYQTQYPQTTVYLSIFKCNRLHFQGQKVKPKQIAFPSSKAIKKKECDEQSFDTLLSFYLIQVIKEQVPLYSVTSYHTGDRA